MKAIKERLRDLRSKVRFGVPSKVRLIHSGEHFFHMSYLGFVSFGVHGVWYQGSALLLLFCIALSLFIKGD